MKSVIATTATAVSALMCMNSLAYADDTKTEFEQAIADTKPIFQFRARFETVDLEAFEEDAEALTTRIRAGFETGAYKGFKFLVDFEHVEAHTSDFNSTINGQTGFPVVADPEVNELNRFQLTYTGLEDTVVTAGRQRIKHDDDRFIGNVGWRQNEQTFDAFRIVNTSVENLKIDFAYIGQVNRIFGDDSPIGRWDSESFILDVDYKLPVEFANLTLSGFSYILDFGQDAPGASSATYGAMLQGKKGPFFGKARFATQSDYAENPTDYTAEYYNVEAGLGANGLSGLVGYEVLGSDDGAAAFSTPLATLHKFNGFADLFLGTPATGLEDLYFTAKYTTQNLGPAKAFTAFATYHTFTSDFGDIDYGDEFNAVATAKFGRTSVLLKYADYEADEFNGDAAKFWLQLDWSF